MPEDTAMDIPRLASFDQLSVGQRFRLGSLSLPRAEVVDFARRFDPQPFHIEEAAGRASMFGELVASGLHTLSAAFGRSVSSGLLADINLGGNQMEVRWPAPVRPDEALDLSAEVMELRPSRTRADLGIAKFRYIAERQSDGALVLDALVTHFLRR
jgi:acyl dehydratase